MLRYVYGHDKIVADFVAQMIPHVRARGFGRCKTIGVIEEDGKLIAGLVYHDWDPEAERISMSGAALPGKQWLTRETIRRMSSYPFHQCRCQMVVMTVPADDERLQRQLAVYGFRFILFPRMFGRERDGVVCRLTDDVWAANKFNRRLRHHVEDAPADQEAA
jgi:RimJ/RimL family protein N-acetyltransferase